MLLDVVGCCRMLSAVNECCRLLMDAVGCCRVLSGVVGGCRLLMDAVGCCRLLLSSRGPLSVRCRFFTFAATVGVQKGDAGKNQYKDSNLYY